MYDATTIELSDRFIYEPLDLTKPTIRVLKILPGHEKDSVRIQLKHVTLTNHEYVCLSYTWGLESPVHDIGINEKKSSVRGNLFDFLKLARKLKIKDWLWIDALSLNQGNILERNHQVQQMGDIYRGAKHVLVYPGKSPRSLKWAAMCRRDWLSYGILRKSLEQTAELPYWTRAWIVQELMLATDCFVVNRGGLIKWTSFRLLYANIPSTLKPTRMDIVSPFCHWMSGAAPLHRKAQRLSRSFEWLVESFVHVSGTWTSPAETSCTDRRDYVYSLLGLADDAQGFVVDYKKSCATLLLDTVYHFCLDLAIHHQGATASALNKLVYLLQAKAVRYCASCAERVSPGGAAMESQFAGKYRFAGLVMAADDSGQSWYSEYSNMCARCYENGVFLPPCTRKDCDKPVDFRGQQVQHLVRAKEDALYCFRHKACWHIHPVEPPMIEGLRAT